MAKQKIDYSEDAETVRWPRLMRDIKRMSRRRRENLLVRATRYRSGPDSCGSVYMGGMAHASLRVALKDSYPGSKPYPELVREVDDKTLNAGIWAAMHTIEYMLAHPMKTCPCCGQVINVR